MQNENFILVLNIGSTTTQAAIFEADKLQQEEKIIASESKDKLNQLKERKEHIKEFIKDTNIIEDELNAIVSRGGIMKPLPAGTYIIDEEMCQDLKEEKYGSHPSAYGPIIAYELSKIYNIPAYTVDPPSTDEMSDVARVSGSPLIKRKSAFHTLSQKAAVRKAAAQLGLNYNEANFLVAHLGGGITVGAHYKGKVIDVSHGLSEGPLTPERSGNLPTLDIIDYVFNFLEENCPDNINKKHLSDSKAEIFKTFVGQGGVYGYLKTKDFKEIEEKSCQGHEKANLILEAMAYQIAKEIGSMAAVLEGKIDSIVLTGALINAEEMISRLKKKIEFISRVMIIPENEMEALALGALRALKGEEKPRTYS